MRFTALPELGPKIVRDTGVVVGARKLLAMCQDGRVPGAARRNGRWYQDDSYYDALLALLGLARLPAPTDHRERSPDGGPEVR